MTADQAIDAARKFARDQGYDASKYEATASKRGVIWTVSFRPSERKPRPGDFFTVFIDEATSMIRLVHGK